MLAWKPRDVEHFQERIISQQKRKASWVRTEGPLDGAIRGPLDPHRSSSCERWVRSPHKVGRGK